MSAPRAIVLAGPGTNRDPDVALALELAGAESTICLIDELVRSSAGSFAGDPFRRADIVVVAGGFSYGDYLRCGAIARFAPVMDAIRAFAGRGGPVLGICNAFQILCESGLLPGALIRHRSLRFVCRNVCLRVETTATPVTASMTWALMRTRLPARRMLPSRT